MRHEGYNLKKVDWIVRSIDFQTALILVKQFHYSKGGANTKTYVHGLFKKEKSFFDFDCLGVAWWIPPTKDSAIVTFPEGDWNRVLSLTRLVVHPSVPRNGASFLLSQSIKLIDSKRWHCLVTYADQWKGHTGAIYKATNWEYVGETKPMPVFTNDKGVMMGRKRGPITLTTQEMSNRGFKNRGSHIKHKFRLLL